MRGVREGGKQTNAEGGICISWSETYDDEYELYDDDNDYDVRDETEMTTMSAGAQKATNALPKEALVCSFSFYCRQQSLSRNATDFYRRALRVRHPLPCR